MSLTLAAAAAAPGLAVGSFLNVVAARVPLRRSVAEGRSACMSCATPIAARDNIPLVSYALLRGRCRHCGDRIPLRYPLVELVTALLVVAMRAALRRDSRGAPRGGVLRRPCRDRCDRRRASDRPEPDRAACGRRLPRGAPSARAEPRVAAGGARGLGRAARQSPSPTRRASAWATSSLRSCSALCSGRPCRSR